MNLTVSQSGESSAPEEKATDTSAEDAFFDRIFATDLCYIPDCWKLCGDGHCCNYSRYKQKFALIGKKHFQETPLLPGELEYMERRGYLAQFGDYDVRTIEFPIDLGTIKYQAIISHREGCACIHAIRLTMCRLYPLWPQYDATGKMQGIEFGAIYEEIERIGALPGACQVRQIPISEINAFIGLAAHIGANPTAAFHMEAFRIAKAAAAEAIQTSTEKSGLDPFRAFEVLILRSRLLDPAVLRTKLNAVANSFFAVHGATFLF